MAVFGSLRRQAGPERARARLVCFPHAGGAANYYLRWRTLVPTDVELVAVQYPGRQDRFGDRLATDMDELVRGLLPDLERLGDLPTVFLGHSKGASVAFESVRRLSWRPALLVVSARPAPSLVGTARPAMNNDDEMLARLDRLGGLQREVLADPELRELVLPVLRADYRVVESYRPEPGARTDVDILAAGGDRDPEVEVAAVGAWREATTGDFTLEIFEGGHFYVEQHARTLVRKALGRVPVR
ncbi:thioesterase II family protein [Plantactinospora sp. WMMB334]|uniref:thioesterase II family protein n=1 Tax=Plantactinospora sp. WMMB334 TaxID=3404119 RepID=UPI003B934E45